MFGARGNADLEVMVNKPSNAGTKRRCNFGVMV